MAASFGAFIRRSIFWEYARGSWQYDAIVALILAFIFLTPREFFRDQARIPNASAVAMLPPEHGTNIFWIDSTFLENMPEPEQLLRASALLQTKTGKAQEVIRIQPVYDDAEKELKGYLAFARP